MSFGGQQHIQPAYSIKNRLSLREEKKKYNLPSERKIARILRNLNRKVEFRNDYDELLSFISDGKRVSEEDARSLVQAATENIEVLHKSVSKFVEAILKIQWVNFQEEVVFIFQKFLVNLSSAHNYYTKCTLNSLVSNFVTGM